MAGTSAEKREANEKLPHRIGKYETAPGEACSGRLEHADANAGILQFGTTVIESLGECPAIGVPNAHIWGADGPASFTG